MSADVQVDLRHEDPPINVDDSTGTVTNDTTEPLSVVNGRASTLEDNTRRARTCGCGEARTTSVEFEESTARTLKNASKASDVASETANNLFLLFASNSTDMMLLGGYNSIIIFLDAGSDPAHPALCSSVQEICSWMIFCVVMLIYSARHLTKMIKRLRATACCVRCAAVVRGGEPTRRPEKGTLWWFIPLRATLFGGFLLCMHNTSRFPVHSQSPACRACALCRPRRWSSCQWLPVSRSGALTT